MGINKKNTDVIVDADIVNTTSLNSNNLYPVDPKNRTGFEYEPLTDTWRFSDGTGIQITNPKGIVTIGDGINSKGDFITTDLSPVLQDIISSLAEDTQVGGVILIGKGDFYLSSDVLINVDNIKIIGAGRGLTTITTASYNFVVKGNYLNIPVREVLFKGVSVEGSGQAVLGEFLSSPVVLWDGYYLADTPTPSTPLLEGYLGSVDVYPLDSVNSLTSTQTGSDLDTMGSPSSSGLYAALRLSATPSGEHPVSLGNPYIFDNITSASKIVKVPSPYPTVSDCSASIRFRLEEYSDSAEIGASNPIFYLSSGRFLTLKKQGSKFYITLNVDSSPTTLVTEVSLGVTYLLTIVSKGTSVSLYKNQTLVGSRTSSFSTTAPEPTVAATRYDSYSIWPINYKFSASMLLYFNKALTQPEIEKIRFGPLSLSEQAGDGYPVVGFEVEDTNMPVVEGSSVISSQNLGGAYVPDVTTSIQYLYTPKIIAAFSVKHNGTTTGYVDDPATSNFRIGNFVPSANVPTSLTEGLITLYSTSSEIRVYPPEGVDSKNLLVQANPISSDIRSVDISHQSGYVKVVPRNSGGNASASDGVFILVLLV